MQTVAVTCSVLNYMGVAQIGHDKLQTEDGWQEAATQESTWRKEVKPLPKNSQDSPRFSFFKTLTPEQKHNTMNPRSKNKLALQTNKMQDFVLLNNRSLIH